MKYFVNTEEKILGNHDAVFWFVADTFQDGLDKNFAFIYDSCGQEFHDNLHTIDYDDETVVILLFEDKQDAVAFADKLKAKNFPAPTVSALARKDLEDFAIQAGYKLRFVRTGEQIHPPNRISPTLDQ